MRRRLDVALVERGLAASRTLAQALVMAGKVRVAGQVETKASRQVDESAALEVESPPRFVSRGGEKLEGAFALWGAGPDRALDASGRICLDVGSSTGGFTDCLLQHGAKMVMAVDVGTRLILPPIVSVLAPGGAVVALIKPQFEVGKGQAPGGLVRDEALRLAARDGIVRFAEEELGLSLAGLAESPIRGREMGNVEYLSFFRKM